MDIYITLDYELFLGGKTGTPENCLVRPMKKLCEIADRYNFRYVIFVDAAYLLRMRQIKEKHTNLKRDYDLVSAHVRMLHEQGHDIQFHFHPQWLYSDYDDNVQTWVLDMNHYKLSDMDRKFAFNSFSEAKNLLDSIIGKKTIAFRAGGFCLDTFSNYTELFKTNSILIDSSVVTDFVEKTPTHICNYSDVPNKSIYSFENTIHLESPSGNYKELCISSIKSGFFKYLIQIKKLQKSYSMKYEFKDGTSTNDIEVVGLFSRIMKLIKGKVYIDSIDGVSAALLPLFYKESLSRQALVLLGHPKNTTGGSLEALDKFLLGNIDSIHFKTTANI